MFDYNRNRSTNEISSGSMADIAFLLLIFFLVATTIKDEVGVKMKLNPYHEELTIGSKVKLATVDIQINAENALLFNGEIIDLSALNKELKDYVKLNKLNRKNTLISLLHDRGTKYSTYLECYNEISIVYNSLWNELAMSKFDKEYDLLDKRQKFLIRNENPKLISESEPTSFGVVQ